MPDIIKGPNSYLTDRIDGLITDTTNSPFTTVILPYKYIANPDAKIKWNALAMTRGSPLVCRTRQLLVFSPRLSEATLRSQCATVSPSRWSIILW